MDREPLDAEAALQSRRTAAGDLRRLDDDGAGVSEAQRRKIGKRGTRLDETKPGSGLGLSIASDLANSYRGTLDLAASPMGGLRIVLDLPSA